MQKKCNTCLLVVLLSACELLKRNLGSSRRESMIFWNRTHHARSLEFRFPWSIAAVINKYSDPRVLRRAPLSSQGTMYK